MNDMTEAIKLTAADFKSDHKPIWCPGCGDYTVLGSITKGAVHHRPPAARGGGGLGHRLQLAHPGLHHLLRLPRRARPRAAAGTGLKAARPDLTVVVTGGDGDGYSIGGNHFMHACRRNLDLTYIVMDNHVYGMTKGQASPTTEPDWDNKLARRHRHPLVPPAGDRAGRRRQLRGARLLRRPERHRRHHRAGDPPPGFSFVEILSPA